MNKNESPGQNRSSQKLNDNQKQCQVDVIKKAVRETFHAMKEIEENISHLQKIRSAFKHDLVDLKDGRLDKILHRQNIDIISKENAVFFVKQKVEIGSKNSSQWYIPYVLTFKGSNKEEPETIINNSITKIHAGGACKLNDGEVKYL